MDVGKVHGPCISLPCTVLNVHATVTALSESVSTYSDVSYHFEELGCWGMCHTLG